MSQLYPVVNHKTDKSGRWINYQSIGGVRPEPSPEGDELGVQVQAKELMRVTSPDRLLQHTIFMMEYTVRVIIPACRCGWWLWGMYMWWGPGCDQCGDYDAM